MLIVASGLKVMNELNQLTSTSLRDVVVLERVESTVASSSTPARSIRAPGSCDEFLSDAHCSRHIRIGPGIRGHATFSSSFRAYLGAFVTSRGGEKRVKTKKLKLEMSVVDVN